ALAGVQEEEYVEAIKLFDQLITNNKSDYGLFMQRGESYYLMGEYQQAVEDFHRAEALQTDCSAFWLAKSYANLDNPVEAIKYLRQHLESDLKKSEKEILLEKAFEKLERTKEWRTLWKVDWYSEFERQKSDIEYQISGSNMDEALRKINILIHQKEDDAGLFYLRAITYEKMFKYNQALVDYSLAVKFGEGKIDYRLSRIKLYILMQRPGDALNEINDILLEHPEMFDLCLERSEVYKQLGNYELARESIDDYLVYFPYKDDILYMGGIICYEAGSYFSSLEYFNKALELSQARKEYFIARGRAYYQLQTYFYADSDFGMALDLDPYDSDIYLNRGKVRVKIGKLEGACYDFNKAFEMGEKKALPFLQKYCDY
ncbi:MAG: tetratricopeptide repeat protein, partial [Bacteroidota bacterium]|nr:tetratricopeptide repeat protein [Bacteroidota bacterium]